MSTPHERLDELIAHAVRYLDKHLDTLRLQVGIDISRACVFVLEQGTQVHTVMGSPDYIADAIDQATAPISVGVAAQVRKTQVPIAVAGIKDERGAIFLRTRAMVISPEVLPS